MNKPVVACCGGGTIGSGFAVSFALHGVECRILEIDDPAALERTNRTLDEIFAFFQTEVGMVPEEITAARARVSVTTDPAEAYREVALIQECGPESYEAKQGIMKVIDRYAPADAIYASSTSGLLISAIAGYSARPERCIGAHPYHPAYLIPLVEITRSPQTSRETVDRAVDIYRAIGKEPVVLSKDIAGFIANRISHAVLREVVSLVKNGVCSVEDADKAMVYGPGMRWAVVGPVMVGELLSPNGTREATERLRATNERIFQDLENLTELPADWGDAAQKGVDEEKANMPDFIGHSSQEIAKFRDQALLQILRLHRKL